MSFFQNIVTAIITLFSGIFMAPMPLLTWLGNLLVSLFGA